MSAPGFKNPNTQLHIDEARRNHRRHQQLLSQPTMLGWSVTFLFYSAVHLVKAHEIEASTLHGHTVSRNHRDRKDYIANNLSSIFNSYRDLEEESRLARYDLVVQPLADVQSLHDNEFTRIRNHMASLGYDW